MDVTIRSVDPGRRTGPASHVRDPTPADATASEPTFPVMSPQTRSGIRLSVLTLSTLLWGYVSVGQNYEQAPIHYSQTPVDDSAARLQRRLDRDDAQLHFDNQRGYLASILRELHVPISSQILVFSKTSFQQKRISPSRPRAIYFSDEVYVGWVPEGDVIEVSSVDPQLGAVFYSLRQQEVSKPRLTRHTHECLQCHASSLTDGVPGLIVRSVYPDASGFPILSAGSFRTDHASPLRQRWGGWYVTGTHGPQRHMGNLVVANEDRPNDLDVDRGANVTDLGQYFDTSLYLARHSDIVALMILEHQVGVHNRITTVNFDARAALHRESIMNNMLERPADYRSPATARQLKHLSQRLLEGLLLKGEAPLTSQIVGTSEFAAEFAARGPRDRQGRSLRDLDLRRRLVKYPCSYLIYSKAFDALPAPLRDEVYRGLWDILTRTARNDEYAHLSTADRTAILDILRETKTGLPGYWNSPP